MTVMGAAFVEYSGPVPGNITKAEWRREILKPSWEELGEFFHEEMLPLRFTKEGAKLLGFEPRRGEEPGISRREFFKSYTGRKQRQKGHTLPNVWSGKSRDLALKIQDVRATSNGVSIVNHAKALNFGNRHSKVRPSKEMQLVADSEVATLGMQFDESIQDRADEFSKTKSTKVSD